MIEREVLEIEEIPLESIDELLALWADVEPWMRQQCASLLFSQFTGMMARRDAGFITKEYREVVEAEIHSLHLATRLLLAAGGDRLYMPKGVDDD